MASSSSATTSVGGSGAVVSMGAGVGEGSSPQAAKRTAEETTIKSRNRAIMPAGASWNFHPVPFTCGLPICLVLNMRYPPSVLGTQFIVAKVPFAKKHTHSACMATIPDYIHPRASCYMMLQHIISIAIIEWLTVRRLIPRSQSRTNLLSPNPASLRLSMRREEKQKLSYGVGTGNTMTSRADIDETVEGRSRAAAISRPSVVTRVSPKCSEEPRGETKSSTNRMRSVRRYWRYPRLYRY